MGMAPEERLQRAQRAFEVGDHRQVRRLLAPLRSAQDPELRAAAEQLYTRVAVDPAQVWVLAACILLFLAIAYTYLW